MKLLAIGDLFSISNFKLNRTTKIQNELLCLAFYVVKNKRKKIIAIASNDVTRSPHNIIEHKYLKNFFAFLKTKKK